MKTINILVCILLILFFSCKKEEQEVDPCENSLNEDSIALKWGVEINEGQKTNRDIKTISINDDEIIYQIEVYYNYNNSNLNKSTLVKRSLHTDEIILQKDFTFNTSFSNEDYLYYKKETNLIEIDLRTFEEKIIYDEFIVIEPVDTTTIKLGLFGENIYIIKNIPNTVEDSSHILILNTTDYSQSELFSFKSKKDKYCLFGCEIKYNLKLWKAQNGDTIFSYITIHENLNTYNISKSTSLYTITLENRINRITVSNDNIYLNQNDYVNNVIVFNGINGSNIWKKSLRFEHNSIFTDNYFVNFHSFKNRELFALISDSYLTIVDDKSGEEILEVPKSISNILIFDDRLLFIAEGENENVLRVYDINTKCLIHEFKLKETLYENEKIKDNENGLCWSPSRNSVFLYTNYRLIELNIKD